MVDTSPFDSFGFQVAFACQALPTDAARHDVEYHGWSRGRHTGPWLYVEIDVSGERHWVGRFERGPADYPFTGTFGCPHPDYLLVAASGQAYVVNARAPQGSGGWAQPPIMPVLGVRRVEGTPLVVLWDFQDMAAYGPEGLRWRLSHFATDGLKVTEARDGVVRGTLWLGGYERDDLVTFQVEASTGRVLVGSEALERHGARLLTGQLAARG